MFACIKTKPALVFFVDSEVDTTIRRMKKRKKGYPGRYSGKTDEKIYQMQEQTRKLYQDALEILRRQGVGIILIPNNGTKKQLQKPLKRLIIEQ
jgi:thymidylate kinase